MITVELYGRTGNNMFQIASAISTASRIGTDPYYVGDDSFVKCFKLKNISQSKNRCRNNYYEKKFSYNEDFKNIKNDTHLDGYFQSEKYFYEVSEKIKKCFSFNEDLKEEIKNDNRYKEYVNDNNNIAIHVRRTDYLKYSHIYPQCGMEYYEKCISYVKNLNKILIFSDDTNWCKENFYGNNIDIIDLDPFKCMYIMSKCKNIAMSNSTFSWWAAWLGNCQNVMYPKRWFGTDWPKKEIHPSSDDCTKDLCPDRWMAI